MKACDACAYGTEIDRVCGAGRDVGAFVVRDEAQFVNAGDEGPDEADVDEGDEEGVRFGAVVGEKGCDCPGGGEDGDDEED